MSALDDFLTPTLTRQLQAEQALINGDPGPRLAMWSAQEPVTVFGAERTAIGSDEVTQAFHWLATRFSNLTDYRFELVAAGASGDLAYTLGYEHVVLSMDGGPVAPLTLRVTHLYRARTASGRPSTATPTPPNRSAPFRVAGRPSSPAPARTGPGGATSRPLPETRQGPGSARTRPLLFRRKLGTDRHHLPGVAPEGALPPGLLRGTRPDLGLQEESTAARTS
jgi:ketosteroid isomerase-like protein